MTTAFATGSRNAWEDMDYEISPWTFTQGVFCFVLILIGLFCRLQRRSLLEMNRTPATSFRQSIEHTASNLQIEAEEHSLLEKALLLGDSPIDGIYQCIVQEHAIVQRKTNHVIHGDATRRTYQTKLQFSNNENNQTITTITGRRMDTTAKDSLWVVSEGVYYPSTGKAYWAEDGDSQQQMLITGTFSTSTTTTFVGEWLSSTGLRGTYTLEQPTLP